MSDHPRSSRADTRAIGTDESRIDFVRGDKRALSDLTSEEIRALAVARRDLATRVRWAHRTSEAVETKKSGYIVTFLRMLEPGEPMIRGGGTGGGVIYEISKSFTIDRLTLPR